MRLTLIFFLIVFNKFAHGQSWTTKKNLLPWESHLQLGHIEHPLGLKLNYSSAAHHHFLVGYLSLHSFMYEEAQEAFDLALNVTPTLIEAHLGKMLACKRPFLLATDFDCGNAAYNAAQAIIKKSNQNMTKLQSSLLSTIYQWYKNQSSPASGEREFLNSMIRLMDNYKNESDLMAWWGLAMLSVGYQNVVQHEVEPEMIVAARNILNMALVYEPNHPGALHYLVQSYAVGQQEIAESISEVAKLYRKIVASSSHAQQIVADIWMRTGAWLLALEAEESAVRASLTFCASRLFNRPISIPSDGYESLFVQMNRTSQLLRFYQCDASNRARSMEWLSFIRLQVGDWKGSLAMLHDLYIADEQSMMTPNHYLSFAYRTESRTILELFHWFSYSEEFLHKFEQVAKLHEGKPFALLGENSTNPIDVWSEAAYRFVDCLQILVKQNVNGNASSSISNIDEHLTRFFTLSNRTKSSNKYVSNSILMMILQIHGIRHYINGSWQECLNELSSAVQIESAEIDYSKTSVLIPGISTELLAIHLLLIYENHQERMLDTNATMYVVNGTSMTVDSFPWLALSLYQKADQLTPNRAIITLGMARAHDGLGQKNVAVTLYQQLLYQMTSANQSDSTFLAEINEYLDEFSPATHCRFSSSLLMFSFVFILFK